MMFTPAKTRACLALIGFFTAGLQAWGVGDATPIPSVIPPILLVAPKEHTPLDDRIRAVQKRVQRSVVPAAELERLGWLWIAKARASSDPGYYTLAGIAADALEKTYDATPEAWLLRGHVLQTRHRFADAEALSRRLVSLRGSAADYALLGDALYDEGQIAAAAEAYQHMVDLKPGLDSYSRAANIRWIKGDLAGAIELQSRAVAAGGPGDPGAIAWSLVRLAQLVWQQGDALAAGTLAAQALEQLPEYQPALLLRGRLLLASGHPAEALAPLARAAEILPLPEPRWAYADALRAAGQEAAAVEMETRLVREGQAEDPRTVALFLATRGTDAATAVRLASAELKNRADVMTHSVSALALASAGRLDEALAQSSAALAEDTADARLWLQAARVAALAGTPNAATWLQRAQQLAPLLLPSERRLLDDSFALLPGSRLTGNVLTNTHQKKS